MEVREALEPDEDPDPHPAPGTIMDEADEPLEIDEDDTGEDGDDGISTYPVTLQHLRSSRPYDLDSFK
jgi:hypothetical protein